MLDKHLFLVIAIFALFIVILRTILFKEGFEDATPNPEGLCPQKPWWETEAPKQIVASDTGVKFPVLALEKAKGIASHFQIPYMSVGDTEPSGCISVVTEQGTYTAQMCDANDISQRWRIVKISKLEEYQNILKAGKEVYSGISSYNVNENTHYGFFMVISVKDPSKALAHVGNNLSVQTVGPFSGQKWDITKEDPSATIAINDSAPYTEFDSHFIPSNSFNPIVGGNPSNAYMKAGQKAMAQKPLSININVAGDALKSVFGIEGSQEKADGDNIETISQKKAAEAFNPDCPNCPTILTDYIKNNEVPCRGCNLDSLLTQ